MTAARGDHAFGRHGAWLGLGCVALLYGPIVMLCRLLGWMLIAAALAAGAAELVRSILAGAWETYTLGEAWSWVSANSLIGFGSLIENQVSPDLWLRVGLPLLTTSLWIVLGAPGLVLLLLCRRRRRTFGLRR